MRHKARITLVAVVCALLAVGLVLYPLVGNCLSQRNRSLVQTAYTESVAETEDEWLRDMLAAAEGYNETLARGTAFTAEALAAAEHDYAGLLALDDSGVMGYIEIPKINVFLPIYHGTDAKTLDKGVGHLLGSSLPVGGGSTHSVLSAHSGLAASPMFSDLDQLRVGDVFYLHVLDHTLAYEIDEIHIVLPEDTSLLSIEQGADLCTLVTCTPFGVNTHRLLVRGHRAAYKANETAEKEAPAVTEPVRSTWWREYIKGLLIGLGAALLLASLYLLLLRPRKRGKHECRKTSHRHPAGTDCRRGHRLRTLSGDQKSGMEARKPRGRRGLPIQG